MNSSTLDSEGIARVYEIFARKMKQLLRETRDQMERDAYKEEAIRHALRQRVDVSPTVSPIASVTWSCKRPSDPVYPVGSDGWLMEQMEARKTPGQRMYEQIAAEDNKRRMDDFLQRTGLGDMLKDLPK